MADRRIHVAKDADPRKSAVCLASLETLGWRAECDLPPRRRFDVARRYRDGFTLYCDGDFLWLASPTPLFETAEGRPDIAAWCVQHPPYAAPTTKKDGIANPNYPRKNWSSLILWNHAHPVVRRLPVHAELPYLHRFAWCPDAALEALHPRWNVLAGVQTVDAPAAIHFTHGIPGESDRLPSPYDRLWEAALCETT